MKVISTIIVLIPLLFLLSACSIGKVYLISYPTASATLVQSWKLADFLRVIQEHQNAIDKIDATPKGGDKVMLPPIFDVPFGIKDVAKLKSCARDGDMVLWYCDHWADLEIEYICLQRFGKIVWIQKRVHPSTDGFIGYPIIGRTKITHPPDGMCLTAQLILRLLDTNLDTLSAYGDLLRSA